MGTLFNVSLSAYRNCTKRGRKKDRLSRRSQGEESNNATSMGSLGDATLAAI